MPRPKTSLAKAKLTGEIHNHPGRFKDRGEVKPGGPIGKPSGFLSDAANAAWHDFKDCWPWLTTYDRAALELLCVVRAEIEDPTTEKKASLFSTYRLMLSDFGGTPVSRSKISLPADEDEPNPFDEFYRWPS